jgi:hypothetical protein
MSWQVGQRIVAEAAEATVRGSSFAGGAQVHIDVAFRLVEWPWETNGPISLVPQPSEIKARVTRGELNLGFAIPNPAQVIVPPRHSASSIVRFTLLLSTAGLVALETARDGGSIDLVMSLVAHPFGLTVNSGMHRASTSCLSVNSFRFSSKCRRNSGSWCSRASVTAIPSSPSCVSRLEPGTLEVTSRAGSQREPRGATATRSPPAGSPWSASMARRRRVRVSSSAS